MTTWEDKEHRSFLKSGIIAATFANIHRDPKRVPTFYPEDFTPKSSRRSKEPRYLSVEDSEIALVQLTHVLGGQDLRELDG